MFLTKKESQILEILQNTAEKMTLSDLSVRINSNLPYVSHLVSKLEARSLVKTEPKDNRSKYILLDTESAKSSEINKLNKDLEELSLKLISFFTKHASDIPPEIREKLFASLSDSEQQFIISHRDRIETLEETWEEE